MTAFLRRVIVGFCFALLIFSENNSIVLGTVENSDVRARESKKAAAVPTFQRFSRHSAIVKGGKSFKGIYFLFVDNTSSLTAKHGKRASSDGSFLHPYRTLAEAEANSLTNDVIYVFPGDGTTNGMASGIVLQAGQKLWGAGVSHVLRTSGGSVTIPAAATSSPRITNPNGDGVALAADNEVSGI